MKLRYMLSLLVLLSGSLIWALELQETKLYLGAAKYSQSQEDQSNTIILGKDQDEEAFSLGIGQYVSFEALPWKQTKFYGDYSYTTNTDKRMHHLFAGVEGYVYPFSEETRFQPYAGIGLGYSRLIWGSDPIATIDNKDAISDSAALEVHIGLLYHAFQDAAVDLFLRHIRYQHTAKIKIGTAESELIDRSQTSVYLGVRF